MKMPVCEPECGGVPYYEHLGELDGADPDRLRKRTVPYNFKLAYTMGWYAGRKATPTAYGQGARSNEQ